MLEIKVAVRETGFTGRIVIDNLQDHANTAARAAGSDRRSFNFMKLSLDTSAPRTEPRQAGTTSIP